MTTYNTGNPLGSAAAKDLFDNAQNMDFALNDITQAIWTDRRGKKRKTWYGIEEGFLSQLANQEDRFNLFIQNSGYEIIGDYIDGPLTINEYNQIVRYDGEFYKLNAETDTPYHTMGNTLESWIEDSVHFVSIGDVVLRQNLMSEDEGLGDALVAVKQPFAGAVNRTQHNKNEDFISVKDAGAIGNGVTDDTQAFISAGKGAYVPDGTYLVDASIDVKYYWGPGKLKYPTAEERWVGLSSKGTLYIRNDDVNSDDTPNVPTDGLINLADGELRFLCDLDGDGDYDADMHGKNNLYISADNSIHLRVSPQLPEEGRLRIAATTNTNFIQSGKDYDGTIIKNFALSPYRSTDYWLFIHSTDGYVSIGNNSSPAAPLHIYKDAVTGQLIENTSGSGSRIAFKGSTSTSGTSVTIGCDSDDLAMRAGGVERLRVLSAGTIRPGADNTQNLGSSSFRFGTVFAGTGSINTSDETEKYFIPVDDRVLDAWEAVNPWKFFVFSDALDKKDGGARIHFGLGAQSIAQQFIDAGIDPTNYAFFCYDEWPDHYEDIYETVETENGFEEVMVERRLIVQAGSRYGIRYDEAFAIEAACSRRKLSRLEARIEELESKLI